MTSSLDVRKVAQDVVVFVWFKHGIVPEISLLLRNLLPHLEIMPEFSNNLRVAVWVETFRLDFRLKRYLTTHLIRMTSSVELFANYVSHIFYTFLKDSQPIYEQFFATLSIATYFGLRCWENEFKAFLNTTVELFCAFYEKELRGKFEDQGSWNDFNKFLESNFDLAKYKSLKDGSTCPSEYFGHTKESHEKVTKVNYALQLFLLQKDTQSKVESDKNAVSFGESVADKLNELCQYTIEEVLGKFANADSQVKEIYQQTVGESSGGLTSKLDPISLRKYPTEKFLSSPIKEKELVPKMSTASNSSEIMADLDKSGNQAKEIYLETVKDSLEALEREVEKVSLLQGQKAVKDNIPIGPKSKKRELLLKIRKITQDVLMFVWFKQKIVKEPGIIWAPHSEFPFKFINNLSLLVWMQYFRNDFKWKSFLNRHFERMISTAELFANYVSFACYTSIENTTNAFAGFLDVLSLVIYFTIHCWEKRCEEYLSTSVELVCSFFEQEFLETFEDQGNWFDFNDYLEANFNLPKYESLIQKGIRPMYYFKRKNKDYVEDSELYYNLQCIRHGNVHETDVEIHEKAVSFAQSIADELEALCQDAIQTLILDFHKTDSAVDEIYIKKEMAIAELTKKVGNVSSPKVEGLENIPSSLGSDKKELMSAVRKVTQNVQMFVWYKQKIINEKPTQYSIPNISPELVNNLRTAVSMNTFRNAFKWKGFLERHFKRMSSTPELFVEYVSFACYTLIEYTANTQTVFFKILSLVTYIVLYFWDKGFKEFLNTSVELVCTLFEKELCENFEDDGGWKYLNEYLVKRFDLKKYKRLIEKNMLLTEYLKQPQSIDEENVNSAFSLQYRALAKTTRSEVETNKMAISFVESVEDKMEQLCLQSLEEIIKDFDLTGQEVGEICQETVEEASGGLAREVNTSSENVGAPENVQVVEEIMQTVGEASGEFAREVDDMSENVGAAGGIPSETKSEVKEQLQQMIKSHSLDIQSTLAIAASSQVSPRSETVKQLLDDITKDYSELGEVIKDICKKHEE